MTQANKYRVLVKVTEVYALEISALNPESAVKVAKLQNYYTGQWLGKQPIEYEVVDNDFETTN